MHRVRLLIVGMMFVLSLEGGATSLQKSLAMFESGATQPLRCAADRKRGASGEVSRYQIMPAVWRAYTKSRAYENPAVAWTVAKRILDDRTVSFRKLTGRQPDPVDVYLLWNKPGHFQAVKFNKGRVKTLYRRRAERFANLWQALYVAGVEKQGIGPSRPLLAAGG